MGIRPHRARTLLSAAAALCLGGPAIADETPLSELVIYGLDGDYGFTGEGGPPGRLFRFVPGEGTYQVIGDTLLEGTGQQIWDWEALCYIPDGPNKGAYAVPNDNQAGATCQKLTRISMFDATVTLVGSENLGNVRGMTVARIGGEWKIMAVRTNGGSSRFFIIDPATGARETPELMIDRDPGPGVASMRLWGLARDVNGVVYSVDHQGNRSQLWIIDPATGAATAPGPAVDADRVEALEVAVGNTIPAFSGLPAATAGWPFDAGVLMGFADDDTTLVVFNTLTGAVADVTSIAGNPVTVPWTDVEGLVFLTKDQDPQNFIIQGFD
jgi:hypothetical protein